MLKWWNKEVFGWIDLEIDKIVKRLNESDELEIISDEEPNSVVDSHH